MTLYLAIENRSKNIVKILLEENKNNLKVTKIDIKYNNRL